MSTPVDLHAGTETAHGAVGSAETPEERPAGRVEVAIARRAFHQIWIGATVCAVVFGGTAASSALAYVTTFPTEAARLQIAASMSNDVGFAVLMGPIGNLDTVGGYTVYKNFAFLTSIGAVWAVLAATRLLRGEEDAGRWQLVLAGSTRAGRATVATLGALGAAVAVIVVVTAALVALAGRSPDVGFGVGESILYALSVAIAPAVFVAVGAVTSQLGRNRRVATGLGMATLAVAFVIRMVADSGPGAEWLRWFTPFGWIELIAPFTQNDLRPLIPSVVTIVVLGVAASVLADRRDVGGGLFAFRDVSPVRPFGLRSVTGMGARLEIPVLAWWCIGAAMCGLLMGILAKVTTTASVPESMRDLLDKFGAEGAFLTQYLGIAFLLVATVVALLPASQIASICDEETSGRLVHILVGPTRRARWFLGRLAIAVVAIVAAGVAAGVATWVGARAQGIEVGLGTLVGAGLNVVPTALVVLGIGAVLLSVAPRAAATVAYAVVGWSLIVDLLGSMVTSVSWVENLSIFHTMVLAPAETPEPTTLAVTVGVAVVLAGLATLLFERRDIQGA